MKIQLSIKDPARQRIFLDHLNGELRKAILRSQTRFETTESGEKIIRLNTVLHESIELNWIFESSPTGELIDVKISCAGAEDFEEKWENIARDLVYSALRSAFNEHHTRIRKRELLYYVGSQLDGEYWLRGGVRVAPAIPDDPEPFAENMERVIAFDFEVDAIDDNDAANLSIELSRGLAAGLSLLLNVDLYEKASPDHVWVLIPDGIRTTRLQRGAYIPSPTSMPKKGEICRAGAWGSSIASVGRPLGSPLTMPLETRRILRGLDDLREPRRKAFDSAARMYQISLSLQQRFPTAALAYRVAAIDALQQEEPDCNGFSPFMRKYSPGAAADSEILEYLHGDVRSSHFHAGKFDLGEFSRQNHFNIVSTPDIPMNSLLHFRCFGVIREALVNWMLSIAAPPPPNTPTCRSDSA